MNLDHIGKYRVVGTIGKGAMGEVYKASDPLLNRFVAVKTIAPALAADPDFRRRFQREAQSAAQLSHANIVTVFDFGEENGLTYMAMELLEGRDLKEVVRARDLRLAEKIAVMEQICDGLAFAHAKGVVHRDLKPGNIHLQPNGQVKILDFGLARVGASDMTRTGTVMGTPHYMSPEQVRGEKADARSDVFSLGAVFYELLSHHRPFEADSMHGVLFQILEQEPEPIRKWAPEVPGALVRVVERALAKDPSRRYADAGEMARALAEARDSISGETLAAGRPAAATVFPAGDATVVDLATAVRGATALSLARAPAGPAPGPSARTVRPEPTVGGGDATQAPAGGSPSRTFLFGGAAVLLLAAVAGGALWWRGRDAAPAAPPGAAALEPARLTDVYVANQVELARADLAGRDYESATRRAEDVLKVAPASAEARSVIDQAREAQRRIGEAEAEARAAIGRRDVAGASLALGRLMALDPRHPAVGELSAAIEQLGSRGAVRAAVAPAPASALPAASATPPHPAPTVVPAPTAAPTPAAVLTPASPSATAAAPPLPAPVPAPLPSAPTPVPAAPRAAEAEVRRVIAEYGRAMETRDLALYRSLKPDLTAEDERRLREVFKEGHTQRVGITVDSVRIDGDRATVRATRQDVIDGRPTKAVAQVFRLVRAGATWRIE